MTKKCKNCGEEKDYGDYYKGPYADGYWNVCKVCSRKARTERYSKEVKEKERRLKLVEATKFIPETW